MSLVQNILSHKFSSKVKVMIIQTCYMMKLCRFPSLRRIKTKIRKNVKCSIQIGEESLPQMKEFSYQGVIFMSDARMEWEKDQEIEALFVLMRILLQSVML